MGKKRILSFDKENIERISDYLFRTEEAMKLKNNGSFLRLSDMFYLNLSTNPKGYIYSQQPNPLGSQILNYNISFSMCCNDSLEVKTLSVDNKKPLSDLIEDLSFVNDEISSLVNRISDYYENVHVNFNYGLIGDNISMNIKLSISLSEDEISEIKQWIYRYANIRNDAYYCLQPVKSVGRVNSPSITAITQRGSSNNLLSRIV